MSKKKRPKPLIVVLPSGERYRLVILRVTDTRDDLPKVGDYEVPSDMTYIADDDVCELSHIPGKDRFTTAYVPESVFGER